MVEAPSVVPVVFYVAGEKPRTKGSTDSFYDKRSKKIRTVSSNEHGKAWQSVIAVEALAAGIRLIEGPVELGLWFYFARPKCHFVNNDPSTMLLAPGAPRWPMTHNLGDIDKLERCVLDGLTGVAYADDAQVVRVREKEKRFVDSVTPEPGVRISIRPLS